MCVCARRQPSPTAASPGSPWSPVRVPLCSAASSTCPPPNIVHTALAAALAIPPAAAPACLIAFATRPPRVSCSSVRPLFCPLSASALLRLLLVSSAAGPCPRPEPLRLPRRPFTLPLPAPLPVPRRPRRRLRPAYLVLLVTLLLVCRPASCCPPSPTSALLSPCLPFLLPSSFVLPPVGVVVVNIQRLERCCSACRGQ